MFNEAELTLMKSNIVTLLCCYRIEKTLEWQGINFEPSINKNTVSSQFFTMVDTCYQALETLFADRYHNIANVMAVIMFEVEKHHADEGNIDEISGRVLESIQEALTASTKQINDMKTF